MKMPIVANQPTYIVRCVQKGKNKINKTHAIAQLAVQFGFCFVLATGRRFNLAQFLMRLFVANKTGCLTRSANNVCDYYYCYDQNIYRMDARTSAQLKCFVGNGKHAKYIAQMLKSINCITKRNASHALPLNFIECKQQHKSTNTLVTIELTDTNSSELRRILSTDILQSIVNATFKMCAFFSSLISFHEMQLLFYTF